jgi:hypothetical protein
MNTIPTLYSVQDLLNYYDYSASGHFFKPETMRYFKSRVLTDFKSIGNDEYLFITTEQCHEVRRATLRKASIVKVDTFRGYKINIETIGDFNVMTPARARKEMINYERA